MNSVEHEVAAAASDKAIETSRVKAFFPYVVLAVGVVLSIVLHIAVRDNIQGEAQLRFERQASDAQHVIAARIHSYADVMYGLRAMFSAAPVSRTEFHRYVTALDISTKYPGRMPRRRRLKRACGGTPAWIRAATRSSRSFPRGTGRSTTC